jgi:hypothetical protein
MRHHLPTVVVLLLLCLTSLPAFAQNPDRDQQRQWQWGHPQQPRAGACFYRNINFQGDYFCMKAGDRWPSLPRGFNDQISSIRIFHGALVQVFENGGFTGRRLRIDHDVDSLLRARLPGDPGKSWNDRISAIAVYLPRDIWDQGHP